MENKIRKMDIKPKIMRDAGDIRKNDKSLISGSSPVAKVIEACDRGDTVTRIGIEKIKISEKKLNDTLPRNIEKTSKNAPPTPKDSERKKRAEQKAPLTRTAEMKKIRETYTFRNKRANGDCIKKSDEKVESENDPTRSNEEVKPAIQSWIESVPKERFKSGSQKGSGSSKVETKGPKTAPPSHIRRPIIKTVTSKSDKTKVYKAVNFVDRKIEPTQLQINIPTDMKKTKENKPVQSKTNVKEKRRRDKKKKFARSPTASPVAVRIRSPPTEVAKWASDGNHQKLYYEAWVDTTLAAISKKVKDKNYDKLKLMETFKKALSERPTTPDIDYKMLLDERYTGKIKVNKRL